MKLPDGMQFVQAIFVKGSPALPFVGGGEVDADDDTGPLDARLAHRTWQLGKRWVDILKAEKKKCTTVYFSGVKVTSLALRQEKTTNGHI